MATHHTSLLLGSVLAVCFGLGIWLLIVSYSRLPTDVTASKREKSLMGTALPVSFWFIKKICRAPVTKASWWTSLGICSAAAWATQKLGGINPEVMGSLAALMAAAFTADGRTVARRSRPPEILALRGTLRFVYAEATALIVLTFWTVSPLALAILLANQEFTHLQAVVLGLQILLGIAVGLCAGAICAPAARDISAQSAAALLAGGILTVLEGSLLPEMSQTSLIALFACLIVMFFTAAYGIEYKRNCYYWRKNHV